MKTAVIDIGSNSVRYALYSHTTQLAQKELNSTVLADGLFFSGRLNESAIARTVDAIAAYCEKATANGAQTIYAFATEAVRAAQNGKEFVQAVFNRTGIEVDVLDGATEAKIGFMGAAPDTRVPTALFDMGGASCEIVCGQNGEIGFSHSMPIGCVRLRDGAQKHPDVANRLIEEVFPPSVPAADVLVGIGGTATALGAMFACPIRYNPNIVHGTAVSDAFCHAVARDFFLGANLRQAYPCLTPARANVIGYGALAALRVMQAFGKTTFTVSERDNMEGYLLYKNVL